MAEFNCTSPTISRPPHQSAQRRMMDSFVTGAAIARRSLGARAAGWHLRLSGLQGDRLYQLGILLPRSPSRLAKWAAAWPTPLPDRLYILVIASLSACRIGIGAGIYLAEYGRNRFGDINPFHRRCAQRRPVDRHRHRGLRHRGADARTLLRAGRRRGAGHHDDSHHHPHHRRNVAAGAKRGEGSGLRIGRLPLAHDAFHHSAHRDFRRNHGSDAGLCPRSRRNCAAIVHRFGNTYWNWKIKQADRRAVAADIHLRHFALR